MATTRAITSPFAALALATILVGGAAAAGEHDTDHRQSRSAGDGSMLRGDVNAERMISRMSRWLELDEIQEQELRNIGQAAEPELTALRSRAKENRAAIARLVADNANFESELQTLAVENGQIATEITLVTGRLRADIHAALTPEQQQQLQEGGKRLSEHAKGRHRALPAGDADL